MTEAIKIPKFRKTGRIIQWMRKHEYSERMSKEVENLFFTTNEDASKVLIDLTDYHDLIDCELPVELENLMYEKAKESIPSANPDCSFVHEFLRYCWTGIVRYDGDAQKYIDLYKGKSHHLLQWAEWTKKRLPDYLEDSIDDPDVLLEYANEVVRGRLPEHLENVFFKDVHAATQYAFDVIRGFAPVKLPDALHNFVIMESYKDPDDYRIKTYMKASESDPNRAGNCSDEL